MTGPDDSDSGRHPVELLAEEFVERQRQGEQPKIEDYIEAHPELEGEIRDLFPTLMAMEDLKRAECSPSGPRASLGPVRIESLGDFRIIQEIGRGGMGIVYEAEQESLSRRVAVKVLPRQSIADSSRLKRFHREAQTAAALHHTNIVPIFGTGEHDGYHYYVMPLIPGIGLDRVMAFLRGDGISGVGDSAVRARNAAFALQGGEDDAADVPCEDEEGQLLSSAPDRNYYRSVAGIGVQIAGALDHAHGQGTLHRDIKPANILLGDDEMAWVTDFGLAKALEHDDLTHSGDIVGTLRYMSPEQARGEFDRRSDIYGLGVTLYELASRQPAFAGGNRNRLLREVVEGRLQPLHKVDHQIPRDLATIIEKSCAAEPGHRYQAAGELAEDLQRFLDDRPISARPVTAIESCWRWCRRNRTVASLAACTLLAIVVSAVMGWVFFNTASVALEKERSALDLAGSNLELSLRAFEEVFDAVSGPDLFESEVEDPQTGEATLVTTTPISQEDVELLQRILTFYDRFAELNAENVDLRSDTARAYRRVGEINKRFGHYKKAATAYQDSLLLYQSLQAEAGELSDYTVEIAVVLNEKGRVQRAQGKDAKSREHHEQALEILSAGLSSTDSSPSRLLELARTHTFLSGGRSFAVGAGRFGTGGRSSRGPSTGRRDTRETATEHLETALDIVSELLALNPTDSRVLLVEARSHRLLAASRSRLVGYVVSDVERAISILEGLVDRFPQADHYRFELAETLVHSARGRMWFLKGDGTIHRPERGVEILRALHQEQPTISEYESALARALYRWGEVSVRAGDPMAGVRLREASRIHAGLAARFPTAPIHFQHWHWVLLARHRLLRDGGADEGARELLEGAIEDIQDVAQENLDQGSVDAILGSLYFALSRTLQDLGDQVGADTAAAEAAIRARSRQRRR